MISTPLKFFNPSLISLSLLGSSLPSQGALSQENGQNLPSSTSLISKGSEIEVAPIFYSNVELRHQVNSYVGQSSHKDTNQEPSVQFRAQLGSVLYQGLVDAYLNLSVEKLPKSLAVYQRRPELYANIYFLKSKFLKIRQYNIWRMPFSTADKVGEDYESQWDRELDLDGTVYIIGLNPTAKFSFKTAFADWEVDMGLDLNSRLYSRTQYAEYIDERTGLSNTVEDHIPRLGSIQSLGGAISPLGLGYLKIGGSVYYRSYFIPQYFQNNDLGVQNRYGADRASYYRIRFQLQLNKRLTLLNDFIHFHQGLFTAKRKGKEKRFKNMLRLSCVL